MEAKKGMTEQQKERLIKIYNRYQVFDWILVIVIIATPILAILLPSLPELIQTRAIAEETALANWESFVYAVSNLSAVVMIPIFIIYSIYTIFCFVLYIKVWSIKEIPKRFWYWLDWFLTIVLTAYELFIFYVILFG